MTTTPMEDTGLDVTVLDALDFAVPCTLQVTDDAGDPLECQNPAEWIIVLRHHFCALPAARSPLINAETICQQHYLDITADGATGSCKVCGRPVPLRSLIVSIEPLTKGHIT